MKNRSRPPQGEPKETEPGEDDYQEPNHSLETDHRNRAGIVQEDGPGVDPEDPNLSALYAETGAGERLDELGL